MECKDRIRRGSSYLQVNVLNNPREKKERNAHSKKNSDGSFDDNAGPTDSNWWVMSAVGSTLIDKGGVLAGI